MAVRRTRLPACGTARTSATSNGQRQDAAPSARGPVWAWLPLAFDRLAPPGSSGPAWW
jgi:hypothetical protein